MVDIRQLKRKMYIVLITLACCYVAIATSLYCAQSSFVYFPTADVYGTPADIGLEYEEVFFRTADNERLWGWLVKSNAAVGTILFCHGNAGNITHRLESIRIFNALAMDVLIFDYRGYGKSSGTPGEHGTYLDVEAAWEYLTAQRGIDPSAIVVFGRSLGGAVAAWIATQRRPKALILESTFTSIPDIAADIYPWLPVRLLARIKYPTAQRLPQLRCPLLVIHGRQDSIIPFGHGEKLFALAPQPKSFLAIEGDHNDGFLRSIKIYRPKLQQFLAGDR